ncbi:MAG: zinc ABC transporter substrate-binding protein [Thermoguttaceae bacterium]|nr:zinc ABC transporter substrate-binding protein [Thermoguttaceae bacterium]
MRFITLREPLFFFALWGTLALFFGSAGCRPGVPAPSDEHYVLVTVPPIAGLVGAVAGDTCSAVVLVPPGKEPETFSPTPSEMRGIARCSLFFRVGLPSEGPVLARLMSLNPQLRTVDLSEGLPITVDARESDEIEPEAEHEKEGHRHGGMDPHIWMSPSNLEAMATTIEKTLSETFPENRSLYQERTNRFIGAAEALKRETAEKLEGNPNPVLYVFHPAYGYYCAEFGWRQRAVEAGGKAPKSKEFVELVRQLSREDAKTVFIQPEFSRTAVEKLAAELNLNIEVHSPLGEDPLENIRTLTDALARE